MCERPNENAAKIADLNEDLTPHSLRQTHTSLLAETRVSLEQIMDRLGHTDDQSTKNVYLHVTQEMKKEASQKFGELMRSLR
ncbi:integrase [Bacillus subtilis]|nr:integrase [Bacillus subtilis]